jgi:cell wall-associated NlpC family hydrolase
MRRPIVRLFFATLAASALGACATVPSTPASQAIALQDTSNFRVEPLREPPRKPEIATAPEPDIGSEIVMRALGLLGKRYRYGGNAPETGFDCSGLVRWVFDDKLEAELPRSSLAMSRMPAPDVRKDELIPGDLVFFRTRGRVVSHVGIYIGDGRFVHAATRAGKVRIDRLDASYWRHRFTNAKRVIDPQRATAEAPSATRGADDGRPRSTISDRGTLSDQAPPGRVGNSPSAE